MCDEKIEIVVTFDENYCMPFKVMIQSLSISNPHESFCIWLLHSKIGQDILKDLKNYCLSLNMDFISIQMSQDIFENAPSSKQYPKEMYYRLLAPIVLPKYLKRIIYIDPDILVINSVQPLWRMELGNAVFAAASHGNVFDIVNNVNRVRLKKEHEYFNTGVLLIDLEKARDIVDEKLIFECVKENMETLLLPDQDVFNILYGDYTLPLDDTIWNYDTRYYSAYLYMNEEKCNLQWIMEHTVFLHFCGKQKPWKSKTQNRFKVLYLHYKNLVQKENLE